MNTMFSLRNWNIVSSFYDQHFIIFICITDFELDPQILMVFEIVSFIIEVILTIIDIASTFLGHTK